MDNGRLGLEQLEMWEMYKVCELIMRKDIIIKRDIDEYLTINGRVRSMHGRQMCHIQAAEEKKKAKKRMKGKLKHDYSPNGCSYLLDDLDFHAKIICDQSVGDDAENLSPDGLLTPSPGVKRVKRRYSDAINILSSASSTTHEVLRMMQQEMDRRAAMEEERRARDEERQIERDNRQAEFFCHLFNMMKKN